ncbi:hypothetical protein P8452_64775 [Trifolium repens]|nr:hypothetical protein P8452_64775 [Trifolium repens]
MQKRFSNAVGKKECKIDNNCYKKYSNIFRGTLKCLDGYCVSPINPLVPGEMSSSIELHQRRDVSSVWVFHCEVMDGVGVASPPAVVGASISSVG